MPIIFFGTLSASPTSGYVADTITINNTGSGFFGTMVVKFGGAGGVSGDSITVVSQQQLTVKIPAGVSGSLSIYVANPDGENGLIAGFVVLLDAGTVMRPSLAIGALV